MEPKFRTNSQKYICRKIEHDTLSEFRTIEIDIDSSASLHWGSQ